MVSVSRRGPDVILFEFPALAGLPGLGEELAMPLAHIVEIREDPTAIEALPSVSVAGRARFGLRGQGLYLAPDGFVLAAVRHPERALVVELRNERYRRLVIEVEDPEGVIRRVAAARAAHPELDPPDRTA